MFLIHDFSSEEDSLEHLIHKGVLLPPKYTAKGFSISIKGEKIALNDEQEEIAVAWVKKLGTEYVEDEIFAQNFFTDFAKALNRDKLDPNDVDFSEIQQHVMEEKNRKLTMSKEERKLQAQKRKEDREKNKERYGYATVDGVKVEVGNYTVEPSSIFMGRGKHPLRGRWKRGPTKSDIILNLSDDSDNKEVKAEWNTVWQRDSMWIAKWQDKLTGGWKYVWLSESSYVKQKHDIEKFDKAEELEKKLEEVRNYINRSLKNLKTDDSDLLRRKIATVCYLIDNLKFRVGDEKDEDEADTVGATTLRPEHISFGQDCLVVFDFLGKDSIAWHINEKLDEQVVENMKEFKKLAGANSTIFKGVRSDNVSAFLSEAMPGLTAKVFRTYHATRIVKDALAKVKVPPDSPDSFKKQIATMANLEAAKACNHKKKIPKNWNESLEKMRQSLRRYREIRRKVEANKAGKREARIRRLKRIDGQIRDLQVRIEIKRNTRDYNLNTSLKSYIDPRVYFQWSNKVGYDWKKYYSKTLQRKFNWVEQGDKKVNEAIDS